MHDACPLKHLAAAEGSYSAVSWLLQQGCDVNPIDRFQRTPLETQLRQSTKGWEHLRQDSRMGVSERRATFLAANLEHRKDWEKAVAPNEELW
eukprot:1158739-Pelagomonas_calceolata.AAC.3